MKETYTIEVSEPRTVITDPQRRVYNGCIFNSQQVYTPFEVLESEIPKEHIEARLDFWMDINDYAVSQRGEGSRKRFIATRNVNEPRDHT